MFKKTFRIIVSLNKKKPIKLNGSKSSQVNAHSLIYIYQYHILILHKIILFIYENLHTLILKIKSFLLYFVSLSNHYSTISKKI